MSVDGSRGWASALWNMLADDGTWVIERCGLVFRKNAEAKTFTLFARMPWEEGMSLSAEELRSFQDSDFAGVRDHFAAIGVTVQEIEV
jgi:hypothetical protein